MIDKINNRQIKFNESIIVAAEAAQYLSNELEKLPDFIIQENLAADCLIESSLFS